MKLGDIWREVKADYFGPTATKYHSRRSSSAVLADMIEEFLDRLDEEQEKEKP